MFAPGALCGAPEREGASWVEKRGGRFETRICVDQNQKRRIALAAPTKYEFDMHRYPSTAAG